MVRRCACAATASLLVACATGYGTPTQPRGYLRFEVKPDTTELLLDEQYSGLIAGWVEGVVPVTPGVRRVTLRAEGYITQRFDVEVAAREEVTFSLSLEPILDVELDDSGDANQRPRPRL